VKEAGEADDLHSGQSSAGDPLVLQSSHVQLPRQIDNPSVGQSSKVVAEMLGEQFVEGSQAKEAAVRASAMGSSWHGGRVGELHQN